MDHTRFPSINAGPSAEQVRKAKKTFKEGGGQSSLPAAKILYGPPEKPPAKAAPRKLPPLPRAPSAASSGGSSSEPELPSSVPKHPLIVSAHAASPTASATPASAFGSGGSGGGSGGSVAMAPRRAMPSLALGIGGIKSASATRASRFATDGVEVVHGTNSSALSGISNVGLIPVAARLDAFASSQSPALPTTTEHERRVVAEMFSKSMTSGERGNTLDAWVKSPAQPAATGISVFPSHKATDTVTYADKGSGGSVFPAVVGISRDVPTRTHMGMDHPLTDGAVSPSQIPVVYVPSGRSVEANTQLESGSLRGRARSFPDLFQK